MCKNKIIAVLIVMIGFDLQILSAQNAKSPAKEKAQSESLTKLVESHFAHWDRDHNDVLDLLEVDHIIQDHSVHGRQAAFAVCLRRHMTAEKSDHPQMPHQNLLKLVADPHFINSVDKKFKYLEIIDRELFLPSDPNLVTFHQGHLGDCYLLSVIAAVTHRNPNSIRNMIHPQVTGGFHVVFGNGQKIHVTPLTESELLLGAKLDSRHGSWLAVFEKSYGIIRKQNQAKQGNASSTAMGTEPFERLNYGHSGEIITLITGHHTESLKLNESTQLDQLHKLLVENTREKRLLCVSKNQDKGPPGIVNGHAYAVLGYDEHQKHVNVFNPWGNNFAPNGPPGKANGYTTKNGVFTVPLDQFKSVFSRIVYETDRKVAK